jgi:hypothetical protein
VISNRYIPLGNTLDRAAVVFCACKIIQLFSVVSDFVVDVHKLEFRPFAIETSNQMTTSGEEAMRGRLMFLIGCVRFPADRRLEC